MGSSEKLLDAIFGIGAEEAHQSALTEVESRVGTSLLELAENEDSLRAGIASVDIDDRICGDLVRGGVLSMLIDDDWKAEVEGREELVQYVLGFHTAYRLLGIPLPKNHTWQQQLRGVLPEFSENFQKQHQELTKWLMRRQAESGVPIERVQKLMKFLELDIMTRSY